MKLYEFSRHNSGPTSTCWGFSSPWEEFGGTMSPYVMLSVVHMVSHRSTCLTPGCWDMLGLKLNAMLEFGIQTCRVLPPPS